ncbi:rhodanese-like domain-containing protein [Desulfoluna spongiiphila]|uniref:rhodanese-like domain-containing protein n=1 Tax=Desulfoluna spongiiphila TaxID=419481 RepID=UPI00125B9699|nr:rhodanese-like domain-containing protein [Desulfoluna spongiiphila]VVS95193.1 rhodanese-like domain [Desulfoluna spongiiphila]
MKYPVRMALLVVVAAAVALVWNTLSSRGIPLVGQWNAEVGVVTPAPEADEQDVTVQTVSEAQRLWEAGDVFVDARATESYRESHIKGSVSLSVYEFDALFFDFIDAYPLETKLVTYCSGRLCDESHRLATMLKELGYEDVRIFADGLPAWADAGLPVEEGR